MRRLVPILQLTRAHNCLLAAAGVVIGAWMTWFEPRILPTMLASIATFCVCAAGNVINDMRDIEIDRRNRPDRVLVTGQVSTTAALKLAIALQAVALVCAAVVDPVMVLGIVILASGLVQFYNFRLKRIPVVGNLVIATLGALTFITGGYAVNPDMVWVLPGPAIPAVFAFLLHLSREIIKDAEDIEGDFAEGIRTLPQLIGVQRSVAVVLVLSLVLVICTYVPVLYDWLNEIYKVIAVYIVGLPLLAVLIFVWGNPTGRMLRVASTALKVAMALGAVALVLGY